MLPPLLLFLAAGCIAFFFCAVIAGLRRFALGAWVWFGSLGLLFPSAFFPNIVLVGMLTAKHFHAHVPLNHAALEHVKALALFNGLLVLLFATAIAILHGFMVRRLPLALFRGYAAVVALGAALAFAWIGCLYADVITGSSVLGVSLGLVLLVLTAASVYAYRNAEHFRGVRPARLQPVSPFEYQPPRD
jgi:hypothetical protein